MSISLPPAPVCRAREVLQRGSELFLFPLPFPPQQCGRGQAYHVQIKATSKPFCLISHLVREAAGGRLQKKTVWDYSHKKITLYHPPHVSSTQLLPLNDPKSQLHHLTDFPLSKSSWLDGLKEKTDHGKSLLAKESFSSSKPHWKAQTLEKLGQ